ncbi:hypothetical protein MMYC01_208497 [Madurella mycetomatis]|uniref:Cyclochlorotine biosynthesis protein O n=1 Tax=Madurella mycetomatis TaxID=100816 RepID=A0A175VQS1_9PEZI|nr:hypothetical protein MMYC01_209636 [Madurella mycetomatis]KXX75306.1 hypothetical protein MMYC01_208497 [Madurella mycetomatis]
MSTAEHTSLHDFESGGSTPSEGQHLLAASHYDRPIKRLSALWGYIFVFLVTSMLWGVALVYLENHHFPVRPFDLGPGQSIFKGKKYIACGKSLEEALARECEYDILANHFVHKLCLDKTAIREYQNEGDTWLGYTDMNWTDLIPTTKAMGESGVYWTNQRDHIVHCAMLWKKQWRAFTENRRYWDAIIASEEHVMHCADFLMEMTERHDGFDWREKPMTVEVGYAGCVDMGALHS